VLRDKRGVVDEVCQPTSRGGAGSALGRQKNSSLIPAAQSNSPFELLPSLCDDSAMGNDDLLLGQITPVLSEVPGVGAVVLGGSRASGTATGTSDYDIGLYFSRDYPIDTDALLLAVRGLVDNPETATVTPIGGWGPWIVGGGWLHIAGNKVDILYREIEQVDQVIAEARAGRVSIHYQPGHPHGFCSAHWLGEVALCRALHDPAGALTALKAKATPYPPALGQALIGKFLWEVGFSIENADLGAARGDQTHVAGCAYRALSCAAQVLFALNAKYLINEKGALEAAQWFPLTIADLTNRAQTVWCEIGRGNFSPALETLRAINSDLRALSDVAQPAAARNTSGQLVEPSKP
jgi:Nucleotidyltransferase domain